MRILFTAPFWSPDINSIAKGPIFLGSQGHKILVITSQKSVSLKGKVTAPLSERVDGTEFFRPYPNSKDFTWRPNLCWQEVSEKIVKFQPDAIVGFGDSFYRLPLKVSRYFNLPLIFFFEYLRLDKFSLPIRGSGKIRKYTPGLYRLCSSLFRRYLLKQCSALMFSYYGDRALVPEIKRHCPIVRYVPWCTETDVDLAKEKRDRNAGIYIGSLAGFKNAAELVEAIPVILDQSKTERFTVVGPGEFASCIKQLSEHYGSRLVYIESVSRPDALSMLRASGYGFTPVTDCGLGFIGDCWGTGTPLIATHELDGFLHNGIDTLVANGIHELPQKINSILSSNEMFERIQGGGRERYKSNYTAQAVGEEYLKVLRKVVDTHQIVK